MSDQVDASTEQKNVWYYRPPTQQPVGVEGPLTGVQLLQRAKEGKIGLTTLVRNPVATRNQWVPAERIPSLVAAINEGKTQVTASSVTATLAAPVQAPPAAAPVARPISPAVQAPASPAPAFQTPLAQAPVAQAPVAAPWSAPASEPAEYSTGLSLDGPASESPNPFSPPSRTARRPSIAGDDSRSRYPNLHRYMKMLTLLTFVGLVLIVLFGAATIIISVASVIIGPMTIFECIVGILMGLIICAAGFGYYVLANAGIELIQVVLDIESNTRERS